MVKIAIIGCGLIGTKVAEELSFHGHHVAIHDKDKSKLDNAKKIIERDKIELIEDGFPSHYINNEKGRIIFLDSIEKTVRNAEFIFEYIVEDLVVKQNLFKSIADLSPITSIICSGTLSIDVNALFEDVLVPERTLGLRFIFPVICVPMVEVEVNRFTTGAALEIVSNLLGSMNKTMVYRSHKDQPITVTCDEARAFKLAHLKMLQCSLSPQSSLSSSPNATMSSTTSTTTTSTTTTTSSVGLFTQNLLSPSVSNNNNENENSINSHNINDNNIDNVDNTNTTININIILQTNNNDSNNCNNTTYINNITTNNHNNTFNNGNYNECVICMDGDRDTLLRPCNHLITCNKCAWDLINYHDCCPICRTEIKEVLHVYHS